MDRLRLQRPWSVPWHLPDVGLALLVVAGIWVFTSLGASLLQSQEQLFTWQVLLLIFIGEGSLLFIPLWLGPLRKRASLSSLGFQRPPGVAGFVLPLAIIAGSLTLTGLYFGIVSALEVETLKPPPIPEGLLPEGHTLVPTFLILALWAPLAEETFFRGFLLPPLAHGLGFLWAVSITAALFALIHGVVSIMIPIFLTGVLLALLYHHTRSLWSCVIAHGGQNAIIFALNA